MKCRLKLLAGSALGLLMVAGPAGLANAVPSYQSSQPAGHVGGAMILAQNEDPATDEETPLKRKGKGQGQAAPKEAAPQSRPERQPKARPAPHAEPQPQA